MMKSIIAQLNKINQFQVKLLELCDSRTEYLLAKQMDEAEQVQKKEMMILFDMEKELKRLKDEMVKMCAQYQLTEEKLEHLYGYMTTEEKEEVMACQRYAFTYEKKLKNKLINNERLVQKMMIIPEMIAHSIMEQAKENGTDESRFINRKY